MWIKRFIAVTTKEGMLFTFANIVLTLWFLLSGVKVGFVPPVVTAMAFKLVHTSHRYCVFTIPKELRIFSEKIALC